MVSGELVVSVPVGVGVGTVKSGVVGVFVIVLEGSGSVWVVVVVVGDGSLVSSVSGEGAEVWVCGSGDGVTEAVGEGVCVRQGPCVARGL